METKSKGVGGRIASVRICGFRSLADVELSDLSNATVLIGANGSGKSNFIRFFEMLRWMLWRRLGEFVERYGGADDQLYGGNATTPRMQADIAVGPDGGQSDELLVYQFGLSYAQPDQLIFTEESVDVGSKGFPEIGLFHVGSGGHREAEIVEAAQTADAGGPNQEARARSQHYEARSQQFEALIREIRALTQQYEALTQEAKALSQQSEARTQEAKALSQLYKALTPQYEALTQQAVRVHNRAAAENIVRLLRSCSVYQFHDTSDSSNFKKRWDVADNNTLYTHGGNLAAVLYRLEHEDIKRFEMICRHISRILPVFDRFQIEESYGKVSLRWKAKDMDKTFGAHLTSDGSLRFFALVTLLNLPPEMLPGILLLDEPELGLHPAAVALVGGMIKVLAEKKQVIVATQSPLLVDGFDLDEIVVVELRDGRTQFKRLDPDAYRVWLDDNFTTGELWQKNLLGGRP